MPVERIIICVDMDAFFASVEQKSNPHLRGKPIAVIGSGHRTVITTSSYEARKFGVKTGMNIYEARQVCPQLIFVVGNNAKYTHTCTEMEKILSGFTPDMEIYSIDEAFMDITTTHHLFGGPLEVGKAIKTAVKETFGINCTVGIAPNILMAKLASDIAKPDGLRWIRPEDSPTVLKDLPVKELWGVGRKITVRLDALGIRTCGELGNAPVSLLRNKFGIYGETLKAMGMGICTRPVRTGRDEPKSVGHSMTLPEDIWERADIEAYLLKLSEMVGRRARKYGYTGRTVTLVLRYSNFETLAEQTTLSFHTNDTHEIYATALRIISGIKLKQKVRLLGVSISNLMEDPHQIPLMEESRKRLAVLNAMDSVNNRHGDFKVTWGAFFMHEKRGGVISPSWRPSGVKNTNV